MLTTIRSDFFQVSLIKLSMFYRMKAKFLLIGFVLTACRLIQISFTAIGVGKRTHENTQPSIPDPLKCHAMKLSNYWVLT